MARARPSERTYQLHPQQCQGIAMCLLHSRSTTCHRVARPALSRTHWQAQRQPAASAVAATGRQGHAITATNGSNDQRSRHSSGRDWLLLAPCCWLRDEGEPAPRPSVPLLASADTSCIHSNARASQCPCCPRAPPPAIASQSRSGAPVCLARRRSGDIESAGSQSRSTRGHSRIARTSVQWSNALHSVAAIGQLDTALCVLPRSQSERKWSCSS